MGSLLYDRKFLLALAGLIVYITLNPIVTAYDKQKDYKIGDHPSDLGIAIVGFMVTVLIVAWAFAAKKKE